MPYSAKIATCSYCGRRQMLRLSARGGHELACGACGAPLHEMKWLKPPVQRSENVKRSPMRRAPHGHGLARPERHDRQRRRKRRKPLWKKAVEEAFDLIEDNFD